MQVGEQAHLEFFAAEARAHLVETGQRLLQRPRRLGGPAERGLAARDAVQRPHPVEAGVLDDAVGRLQLMLEQRQCLRSEEHTSELQSLMRISYAVFCLKKKKT